MAHGLASLLFWLQLVVRTLRVIPAIKSTLISGHEQPVFMPGS
jgi:hypothetical protein